MDPTNTLASQGVAIVLIPLFVQWLKRTKMCPWIDAHTAHLNRAIAWLLGVVSAVGIHWMAEWHGSVFVFSIDFSALTFGAVVHEVAVIAGQLGGQQMVYRVLRTGELLESVLQAQVAKKGS